MFWEWQADLDISTSRMMTLNLYFLAKVLKQSDNVIMQTACESHEIFCLSPHFTVNIDYIYESIYCVVYRWCFEHYSDKK